MPLLSVVIAVYNEADTIAEVIRRVEAVAIPGFDIEIIVVNDGSTDGTAEQLAPFEAKHKVIHQANTGKGGAVRAGFQQTKGDFIIAQDADTEQDPNDFEALLQPLLRGEADVVFGSRFLGKYLPARTIMTVHYGINRFFTLVCNLLSGYRTTDMWTGYKMYSRKALDAILPLYRSDGIEFEPEVTILLGKLGFRITDVPISYVPRWYEEGKKTNWKHAVHSFVMMVSFAFRKVERV
jgi:glycosyltransferase involved in cell wall biosynthesis